MSGPTGLAPDVLTDDDTSCEIIAPGVITEEATVVAGASVQDVNSEEDANSVACIVDVVTDGEETSDVASATAALHDVTALAQDDDAATEESELGPLRSDAPTPNQGEVAVAACGDMSTSSLSLDDEDSDVVSPAGPVATSDNEKVCDKSSNLRLGLLPPGGSTGGTMRTRSAEEVLSELVKRMSPGTGAQIKMDCCHLYTVIVKLEMLSFPLPCLALPSPQPCRLLAQRLCPQLP